MSRNKKSEIIENLKIELARLESTKRSIYDNKRNRGQKCSSAICRGLGMTWREVVALTGFQPQRSQLPKEELLKELKTEFTRIGSYKKEIYAKKRNKEKFLNPDLLCKILNMTWREITIVCGRTDINEITLDTATDDELIEEYKQLSYEWGKPLSVRELDQNTKYTYEIYRQHFGTITNLRILCGFKINKPRNHITKEDCVRELIRLYENFGRKLTYQETKEHSIYSISTILRKFHTTKINEVWMEVSEKIKQSN